MKLIDTHTHLYLPEFDDDRDEAVKRAVDNGVEKLLLPNIDIHSFDLMAGAINRYPGICHPMLGLHPTSVKEDFMVQIKLLKDKLSLFSYKAVGETGIDLYWDKTHVNEQIEAFKMQTELAIELELPIVIHSREAFSEIFSVLNQFKGKKLKGVFHAFTGDLNDARKAIEMGFFLGIGGILTFKNSGLDKVIKEVGPGNIVLETDSPYLAPVPHRGKRNESSYLCIVNRKLSEIFGIDIEETASVTYRNSTELFNL